LYVYVYAYNLSTGIVYTERLTHTHTIAPYTVHGLVMLNDMHCVT